MPKDLPSLILQQSILQALALDDFSTAYALVQTRVLSQSLEATTGIWTAILQAARHRPSIDPTLGVKELNMRMELAAIAMVRAPKEALTEILGVWRRLEEELLVVESQEQESPAALQPSYAADMGTGGLPGAFQEGDRRRKRDVVSQAVTSGLVSGLGWMLGAKPVRG